jgi:hypothetical protein
MGRKISILVALCLKTKLKTKSKKENKKKKRNSFKLVHLNQKLMEILTMLHTDPVTSKLIYHLYLPAFYLAITYQLYNIRYFITTI